MEKVEEREAEAVALAPPAREAAKPWLASEDSIRFAAFRVVFGIVLFADVTHLYWYRSVFLEAAGWPLAPVLIFWQIALVSMILGYRTQLAAIANYVCCAIVLGILAPNGGFQQAAGDSVAIGLSLLVMILPCAAYLVLDRSSSKSKIFTVAAARWLLAAYLVSVYLDSGIHKLFSSMWLSGFGLATPIGLPSIVWISTAWMVWLPPLLLRLVGWGVIAFELSFPVLYAWRRTRVPAILAGIAMHVGIAVFFPIPVFAGLMISIYAGLLPEKWYACLRRPGSGNTRLRTHAEGIWTRLSSRTIIAIMALWALAIAITYAPQFVTYREGFPSVVES